MCLGCRRRPARTPTRHRATAARAPPRAPRAHRRRAAPGGGPAWPWGCAFKQECVTWLTDELPVPLALVLQVGLAPRAVREPARLRECRHSPAPPTTTRQGRL